MTTINPAYVPTSFYNTDGSLNVTQEQAQQVSAGVAARVESMPPAQKELFLAMIASSDLSPSGDPGQYQGQVNDMLDRMEGVSAALTNLASLAGSSFDYLMKVMVEQAGQQRKDALEERLQAREAAKTELMNQANNLEKSAAEMMSGAIAQLVISIVSAVATIALAGVSMARAGSAANAATTAGKLEKAGESTTTVMGKATEMGTKAQAWSGISQAVGSVGGAMGNAVNTMFEANSKKLEAEGSRDAAQAQELQSLGDLKKEAQTAIDELVKSIINFLKEMAQAEVEMMQPLTKL